MIFENDTKNCCHIYQGLMSKAEQPPIMDPEMIWGRCMGNVALVTILTCNLCHKNHIVDWCGMQLLIYGLISTAV